MKKTILLLVFISCICLQSFCQTIDIETVRVNFEKAVVDKKICSQMIEQLAPFADKPLFRAYLGGFQTIWAKHAFNPFSKLRFFNKGKGNIELAIQNDPSNGEIKMVRYAIQKNCPSFLGYNKMLNEDKKFIQNNLRHTTSPSLQKMLSTL